MHALPNGCKLLLPAHLLQRVAVDVGEERRGQRKRSDDGENVRVDAVPAREQLRHAQCPVHGTRFLSRDKERVDERAAGRRNSTLGAHR
jgi:hypothetical protein